MTKSGCGRRGMFCLAMRALAAAGGSRWFAPLAPETATAGWTEDKKDRRQEFQYDMSCVIMYCVRRARGNGRRCGRFIEVFGVDSQGLRGISHTPDMVREHRRDCSRVRNPGRASGGSPAGLKGVGARSR